MSGIGWDEESRRLRTRSLSAQDLRGEDGTGHLVYLCSPLEQAVLQQLHKDLIWRLPGPELAPHLFSKGLITYYEYEQFLSKVTLTEKNEHLLLALSRRPAGVLEKLLSCLDENDDIPGVKEIAKTLREKQEAIERESLQVESVTPWQTEILELPVTRTVPAVVFEFLRDENKMLKKENEALKRRANKLEAKLKRIKRVQRKLKEAMQSSDSEDTGDDFQSHSHSKQASKHSFLDSDEDRVPTPTEDLQRSYNMQNLSYLNSDHTEQKRHDVASQQTALMPIVIDDPDLGDPELLHFPYAPNPPVGAQSKDGEHSGGGSMFENIPIIGSYFKRDKQTTPACATDSVGKLQTERTSSPRHVDSAVTSQRSTTPEKNGEPSRIPTSGGRTWFASQHMHGQKKTAVDKPSARKQPEPNLKLGAQMREKLPPLASRTNEQPSHASPSYSKTRGYSRTQLKYDQLNNPLRTVQVPDPKQKRHDLEVEK